MTTIVVLWAKTYSFLTDDDSEDKKVKTQKSVLWKEIWKLYKLFRSNSAWEKNK